MSNLLSIRPSLQRRLFCCHSAAAPAKATVGRSCRAIATRHIVIAILTKITRSGSTAKPADFACDLRTLVAKQSLPGYVLGIELLPNEGRERLTFRVPSPAAATRQFFRFAIH